MDEMNFEDALRLAKSLGEKLENILSLLPTTQASPKKLVQDVVGLIEDARCTTLNENKASLIGTLVVISAYPHMKGAEYNSLNAMAKAWESDCAVFDRNEPKYVFASVVLGELREINNGFSADVKAAFEEAHQHLEPPKMY